MREPPTPENEASRIAALRSLAILDTPAEERFDRLTRLAKRLFDVPIAIISLVDVDRQWFKSCIGLSVSETPRSVSFCGHAILDDAIFIIADTLLDERFNDNPLVLHDPHIRFYAGCPLSISNGNRLGTLCLIDTKPRHLNEEDLKQFRELADMVEQEIAAVHMFKGYVSDATDRKNQTANLYEANLILNVVLENTDSYVHVRDTSGRYLYINGKYEEVFQCTKEETLGKHYNEILPPEIAQKVAMHEQQLINTKQSFQTENIVQQPDGPHIYLVSRSPLMNTLGDIIGTMGVGIDITKMKQLEAIAAQTLASLKQSEERWMFALEGAGEGVWDWDMVNNKVQYSKRWKEMIGYDENDISDALEEWSTRVYPDDFAPLMAEINANIEGKTTSFSYEHRFLRKDGTYQWIHDRGMVVQRDAAGNPTRMVGTHSDISERKQMDKLKSEFISTVSHELRTPLTSIRGSLGLLEAGALGQLPPKALEILKIAHKNSQRLILLVNDILDMEKLLSGKMVYNIEPINLVELISISIESNAAFAANYQVHYLLNNHESTSVLADLNRLQQVMANIMSNAAKFSPPNSVVEIGYSQSNNIVRITIEDHGQGIPEEFQGRIFQAFSQANNSSTRQHGGTGLGLNISKKLMEDMGGDMGYITTAGKGTIFWISLPLWA